MNRTQTAGRGVIFMTFYRGFLYRPFNQRNYVRDAKRENMRRTLPKKIRGIVPISMGEKRKKGFQQSLG